MTIYALKGNGDCDLLGSLKQGEGRFGWSYVESADLHALKAKVDVGGWTSLTPEEQDCYQAFLLDLKEGDYVVYINVPDYGKCALARVTGAYFWRYDGEDFNHRFPVDVASVRVFDRNDAAVHPSLSARLKLQGRYWRIYLQEEFEQLLSAIDSGRLGAVRDAKANLAFLSREIQPLLSGITEKIHRCHPNYDLEALFVDVFRAVPGVKEVKWNGGAGDHGADIVVVFETGLPITGMQKQETCVVQVKSFEGEQWDTKAVDDIRRAFDHYPEAACGLIVSTATTGTDALESSLDQLRRDTGKPVSLLIGADVAAFLLRYGRNLLG